MKHISINNREYDLETIKNDYKTAKKYKNVLLGEEFLFFKNMFKTYYISYETIKYAFRRIMAVPAGKKTIEVDYIVIADKRKELASAQIAGHVMAGEIMEELKQKAVGATFSMPERLKR